MPRFFCSTQEKEVIIRKNARDITGVKDDAVQPASGRSACLAGRLGCCLENVNCPLDSER